MVNRSATASVLPLMHELAHLDDPPSGRDTSGSAATRFPTLTDVEFYRSRQELPTWAAALTQAPKMKWARAEVSLIDLVVNSHAGVRPTSGEIAVGNLLSILRGYRRRGEPLATNLFTICRAPGCAINPEKRAAFALKWARRIAGEGS
jgi:hypothetical protein